MTGTGTPTAGRTAGVAPAWRVVLALCIVLLVGCAGAPRTDQASTPAATAASGGAAVDEPIDRRPFAPMVAGERVLAGISYGPFREGQAPGGPWPSEAELEQDLRIIAEHWGMIRMYSTDVATQAAVRIIAEHDLPIRVLLGAWIAPDEPEANAAEVARAIELANSYPEVIAAVNVGNETQVFWSWHRSSVDDLIRHLRTVRAAIAQPVTTADDYNFWNRPESHAVAAEVDFILLHAYAMWNQQTLDDAVPWTDATVASIRAIHPDVPIVLGETGWATEMNPDSEEQARQIIGQAGESEQARFYAEFTAWAREQGQPYFYFAAFDEPWKGGDDPREVEKHWGLFDVDRQPKLALRQAMGWEASAP